MCPAQSNPAQPSIVLLDYGNPWDKLLHLGYFL